MALTQKKLQKIMDKYYEDSNNIHVQGIHSGILSGQAFMIKSPYIGTMKENITLTLYYNKQQNRYLLSDDGYNIAAVLPGGFTNNYNLETYMKSSVKFHHVQFNPDNQAFQVTFKNINQITEAYHFLIQTIIDFLGAVSFSHMKKPQQSIPEIANNYWDSLRNNLDEHPEDVDKSLFNSVKQGRDNAISTLDDTEKLIKIRATIAYVRSLREQVRTANEILASISHNKYVPHKISINAKQIAKHLDNDITRYAKFLNK